MFGVVAEYDVVTGLLDSDFPTLGTAALAALTSALQWTVHTVQTRPETVPEIPEGWVYSAEQALKWRDPVGIYRCALAMANRHCNYWANFAVRPWLFDLRNAQLVKG